MLETLRCAYERVKSNPIDSKNAVTDIESAVRLDEIAFALRGARWTITPVSGRWLIADHLAPVEEAARKKAVTLLLESLGTKDEVGNAYRDIWEYCEMICHRLLHQNSMEQSSHVVALAGIAYVPSHNYFPPDTIDKIIQDMIAEQKQWPESFYVIAPSLQDIPDERYSAAKVLQKGLNEIQEACFTHPPRTSHEAYALFTIFAHDPVYQEFLRQHPDRSFTPKKP